MLQKGQEVEVIYHRDGDVTIHNPTDEKQLEKLEIVAPNKFAHPVHNLGVGCMVRQLLKHVAFRNVTAVLVNAVFVTPVTEDVSVSLGNIQGKRGLRLLAVLAITIAAVIEDGRFSGVDKRKTTKFVVLVHLPDHGGEFFLPLAPRSNVITPAIVNSI